MILVTGSIIVQSKSFEEARRLSIEHTHRSRKEPGCISHDVHIDCDNPMRLVFVERWADRDALLKHFAVPASRQFIKDLSAFLVEPAAMEIYETKLMDRP
ncbi:MAG: antibiotic biosynthesis monooxygenase [Rhizobiales bacterium]|nr:antibiotic biosynthesis monooxygenase [Hyphomicrobiales bacterium]